MTTKTRQFIDATRSRLQSAPAMDALQDPLGGLVALVQAGPQSHRSNVLQAAAHGIFDDSGPPDAQTLERLDRTALLVICRLAEEHLACRYSGEEWGEALKTIDAVIDAVDGTGPDAGQVTPED